MSPKDVSPAPSMSPVRQRSRGRIPDVLPAPPAPKPTMRELIDSGQGVSKFATVATGKVKEPDIIRPSRVPLLPASQYAQQGEEKHLYEEQETSRVETLMLKGVRDVSTLSKLLNAPRPVIERRIRRVYARWEVTGGQGVMRRARGEALARTERLVLKLEEILQGTQDNRERIVALKELHTLGAYLDTLRGLTPDAIARLNMVADGNPIAARALKEEKALTLLSDLVARLKVKAKGDIEGADSEEG